MRRLQDALSESHGSAAPPPPPLPSLETSILKENLASLEERVNTVRTDAQTRRSQRTPSRSVRSGSLAAGARA
jgi:hypothetical protein